MEDPPKKHTREENLKSSLFLLLHLLCPKRSLCWRRRQGARAKVTPKTQPPSTPVPFFLFHPRMKQREGGEDRFARGGERKRQKAPSDELRREKYLEEEMGWCCVEACSSKRKLGDRGDEFFFGGLNDAKQQGERTTGHSVSQSVRQHFSTVLPSCVMGGLGHSYGREAGALRSLHGNTTKLFCVAATSCILRERYSLEDFSAPSKTLYGCAGNSGAKIAQQL